MLSDCTLHTIISRLRSFHGAAQLRGVCIDMSEKYRIAVNTVFPDAEIIVDKFRVLRWVNRAVDRATIRARRENPEETRSGHWKQIQALLKRRRQSLSTEERTKLESWFVRYSDITTAYSLKEEFFGIYDCQERREATLALQSWEQSVPKHLRFAFKEVLAAVKHWRTEILAYFPSQKTLATMEATVNRIRATNATGHGHSFQTLRAKLLFGQRVSGPSARRGAA
jgi:transposase